MKRQFIYRLTIALSFVMISNVSAITPALAHPHAFIAQDTVLVFDDKGLAGFHIYWTFDEMFSAMIAQDFDPDKNGRLDKKEIATIKEKAFEYIATHNYYINIKINSRPFAVKFIKNFKARLENGKLIYDFFVPCHVIALKTPKTIVLSPYDPEYYSAIYFPDRQHIYLKNSEPYIIDTEAKRDMSTLIFHETVNPLAIFIHFRRKQ